MSDSKPKLSRGTQIVIAIVAIPVFIPAAYFLFGVATWFYITRSSTLSPADWPYEVKELVEQFEMDADEFASIKVFDRGGFIDTEYLWVMPVSSSEFVKAKEYLELEVIDDRTRVPGYVWDMGPSWWSTAASNDKELLKSSGFVFDGRGNDGDHFFAIYDESTEELRVWNKSNF